MSFKSNETLTPCTLFVTGQGTAHFLCSLTPPGLCRLSLAAWSFLSTQAKTRGLTCSWVSGTDMLVSVWVWHARECPVRFQARACTLLYCWEPSLGQRLPSLGLVLPSVGPVTVTTLVWQWPRWITAVHVYVLARQTYPSHLISPELDRLTEVERHHADVGEKLL